MRQTRTTYGITCAYREYEYAARVVRPNNIAFLHGPTARQIERQDTWSIAVDCSVTQVEAAVPLAGSATFLPPCLEAKAQRCPCQALRLFSPPLEKTPGGEQRIAILPSNSLHLGVSLARSPPLLRLPPF